MATIIEKPKITIDPDLLRKLRTATDEVGQVILHFLFATPATSAVESLIRIWPTTYLYDQHSPHRSDLVSVENITLYPMWQRCHPGKDHFFTLIFGGLPRSCTAFDFIEHCDNQAGAFVVRGIQRNKTDVYYLQL